MVKLQVFARASAGEEILLSHHQDYDEARSPPLDARAIMGLAVVSGAALASPAGSTGCRRKDVQQLMGKCTWGTERDLRLT